MAGRFQKVALAIIIGSCLAGIGFQHYVRGPRQRLERISSAVAIRDWAGFLDAYPDNAWSKHPWSKQTTRQFFAKYIEPKSGQKVTSAEGVERWFGSAFRRVTLYDTAGNIPLLELSQWQDTFIVWSTSTSRVAFPTGWSESIPTPILMIRDLAPAWYPHPELSEARLAERVSEYEFYVAEEEALRSFGVERLNTKPVFGVSWTVKHYLANLRKLFPKLRADFDRIDSKYSSR